MDLKAIETFMNRTARLGMTESPAIQVMGATPPEEQPFFHCRFTSEQFDLGR